MPPAPPQHSNCRLHRPRGWRVRTCSSADRSTSDVSSASWPATARAVEPLARDMAADRQGQDRQSGVAPRKGYRGQRQETHQRCACRQQRSGSRGVRVRAASEAGSAQAVRRAPQPLRQLPADAQPVSRQDASKTQHGGLPHSFAYVVWFMARAHNRLNDNCTTSVQLHTVIRITSELRLNLAFRGVALPADRARTSRDFLAVLTHFEAVNTNASLFTEQLFWRTALSSQTPRTRSERRMTDGMPRHPPAHERAQLVSKRTLFLFVTMPPEASHPPVAMRYH